MAQITICLTDDLAAQARIVAEEAGTSTETWVSDLVAERLKTEWPEAVLAALGSFPDFPDLEEIRAGYGPDSARESVC